MDHSLRAFLAIPWRSVDSIRNIAFTDTQVYCTTGTGRIAYRVAEMLQSTTDNVPLASRRLTLTAVFSSSLGVGLIFGFQPPLIALSLSRLGYSSFAIGSVTAASLIAVILCGPFYPRAIVRLE